MPEFEKDFVLRQTKGIAQGLGKFLSQKSVDDIMQLDEDDAEGELLKSTPENKLDDFLEENKDKNTKS